MSEMSLQDQLNKETQKVNEEIMRVNFQIESRQKEYDKARAEAKKKFGTDDFDELCAIAEQRAANNDKKVAEHKANIAKKMEEINNTIRLEKEITQNEA